MDPDLPEDWESQIIRAYTVFGAEEFGIWGRLDPKFLSEKAKGQLRDIEGKFREMRGKIAGRATRQHARGSTDWPPDTDWRSAPTREPDWLDEPRQRSSRPRLPDFRIRRGGKPPLRESEVRTLNGAQAYDALLRAGFKHKLAERWAWTGSIHTADGRTFAHTPSTAYLRGRIAEMFNLEGGSLADMDGLNEEIDRILRAAPKAGTDARYALARMRDLERIAPGLRRKAGDPFMVEFDDLYLAQGGALGSVNGLTDHNRMKVRTELYGRSLREFNEEDRKHPDKPSRWEEGREWAGNIDALMYIITHEMGHIVDDRFLTPGSSRGPINRRWWRGVKDSEGTSAYGRSDAAEGYAEAFARFVLARSQGQPVPEFVERYAEKFGWEDLL